MCLYIGVLCLMQLSINNRFLLVACLPVVLLALVYLLSYQQFDKALAGFRTATDHYERCVEKTLHLHEALLKALMPANDYLIHGRQEERQEFARESKQVEILFSELSGDSMLYEESRQLIKEAYPYWSSGRRIATDLLAASQPVGDQRLASAMEQMDGLVYKAAKLVERAHEHSAREVRRAVDAGVNHHRQAQLVSGAGFLAALLVLLVSVSLLARFILTPLRKLEEAAERLGEGQFAYRVEYRRDNEFGHVAEAFNRMAAQVELSQASLEELSLRDPLTGVWNRRALDMRMEVETDRSRRHGRCLSVIMLDLDHFKSINDQYGHEVGDAVLRQVAQMLEGIIRPTDHLSRYGGEEFVAVLPETPLPGARILAERLREQIGSTAIEISKKVSLRVTLSAGIATFPEQGDTAGALIHAADKALYEAKKAGRNRVFALRA